MSEIQILPPEILNKLFKYIPRDDLQKLRLVSPTWKERIERDFGTIVLFTNENWRWTCHSQKTRVGTFHSFTHKFPSSLPFILDLQEVTFHRILLKNILVSMLQKCSNIQKLSFSGIVLDQTDRIVVPYKIELPKLNLLQIHVPSSQGFSGDEAILTEFLTTGVKMDNLKEFCFWCSNRELEKLSLGELCGYAVSGQPRPNQISKSLLNLIQKSRSTIEKVQLGGWKSPVTLYFHTCINGRFLYKPFQLDAIQAPTGVPESWDPLIRTQHHLECLRLERHAGHVWNATCKAIAQSAEVILEIVLVDETARKTWDRMAIDLAIFKNCWILTELTLKFKLCIFQNPQLLPHTLKVLKLKGYLSKPQISILPSILRNLKILSLDNCEKMKERTTADDASANAVVDVKLFRELVLMPNMKEMSLENFSMNWSPIMQWCVMDSGSEVTMGVWIQHLKMNPFGIRVTGIRKKDRQKVMH